MYVLQMLNKEHEQAEDAKPMVIPATREEVKLVIIDFSHFLISPRHLSYLNTSQHPSSKDF